MEYHTLTTTLPKGQIVLHSKEWAEWFVMRLAECVQDTYHVKHWGNVSEKRHENNRYLVSVCPACGGWVRETDNYCQWCNHKLRDEELSGEQGLHGLAAWSGLDGHETEELFACNEIQTKSEMNDKEETAMNEMNPEVRTAMEEAAIAAAKAAKHYYEKADEQIASSSMSENDTRSFHYMAAAINRLMDCMGQHDTWELVTKE